MSCRILDLGYCYARHVRLCKGVSFLLSFPTHSAMLQYAIYLGRQAGAPKILGVTERKEVITCKDNAACSITVYGKMEEGEVKEQLL